MDRHSSQTSSPEIVWKRARQCFAKRAPGEIVDQSSLATSLGCPLDDIREVVAHGERSGFLTVERQFFPARFVLTRTVVAWARMQAA